MTYLSIWHIYLSYIYLSLCDHTEYFHCPKMSWCSLFFPPTPQRLTFTDYFTIYSFAFPKMSYSWNYTDIIFSDGLFSLSNMHLWFLQVFSWLESSFLLVWNNIPWSGWTTVYLSIYLLRKILAASKSKKSQLCMRQGLSWMLSLPKAWSFLEHHWYERMPANLIPLTFLGSNYTSSIWCVCDFEKDIDCPWISISSWRNYNYLSHNLIGRIFKLNEVPWCLLTMHV